MPQPPDVVANINLKVFDPVMIEMVDELSRRDGRSGRAAVFRKAMQRMIEAEIDEDTRRELVSRARQGQRKHRAAA